MVQIGAKLPPLPRRSPPHGLPEATAVFAHVPIALGILLACWLLARRLGAPPEAAIWTGWLAAASVCVMREVTQREYQWIEAHGEGLRRNMPPTAGLWVWEWNRHSIEETVVAILAATVVAVAVTLRRRP